MTEKEKAKAYDEAIERAKKSYGNRIAEEIFPELKESKDKKIREAILNGLIDCRDAPDLGWSNFGGIHIDDCIDWLEKQGEQASSQNNERAWLYLVSDVLTWKYGIGQYLDDPRVQELAKRLCSDYAQKLYNPSNSSNTGKNEQKSADKIEPRFKVGDWVVNKFGDSWHIDILDKKNYRVSDGKGNYNYFPISKQDEMHIWTVQDAKDGDVLSYKNNQMVQVGIIEKYVGKHGGCSNTFKIYIGVNWDNILQMGNYMGCSNIHPATKEQRDFLMKEINDAGYEWDTEKKELRRIDQSKLTKFDY